MRAWSQDDIIFIEQNLKRLGIRGLERELSIPASSIRRKVRELGLTQNESLVPTTVFTPEMDVKLVDLYQVKGKTQLQIAEELGVTYPQVNRRLTRLGVKKHGINKHGLHWTRDEVDTLCELIKTHQLRGIAIIMQRPIHSIRKKLNEIGLSHTLKYQPDCVLLRGANGNPPYTMLDIVKDFEPSLAYWERQLNTKWRLKLDVEDVDAMQYQINSMVDRFYLCLNGPRRIDDVVHEITELLCEFRSFANTQLSSQLIAKMRNANYRLRKRQTFKDHPRMSVVIQYLEHKTPTGNEFMERFVNSA